MIPAARAHPEKRLVLVGGGHAHVGVLKDLGMKPEPGLEVVLVAKELDAPYSGMLPGYVAGHYSLEACHIDLVRLAHFAGARVIHGEGTLVDTAARRVHVLGRPPLAYDLLSIDTGITPSVDDLEGAAEHALLVKPVSRFAPQWRALAAKALVAAGPRRFVVIGTGAAGFELILAIRHRLLSEAAARGLRGAEFTFTLVGSGGLLRTHNRRAARMAADRLRLAGVELVADDAATAVRPGRVQLRSGRVIESDATLVATKAKPPPWFRDSGLACDEAGFLAVEPTLQVVGQSDIFAVGDCATVTAHPREKAGVFAVRQAPPLARNIRFRARGLAAMPFVPQRQFLTILSCGDKTAIAARGRLAFSGARIWQLKDRIDRAFMRKFQDLPPVPGMGDAAGAEMACAGCGAKVGPAALTAALDRLEGFSPPGLPPPAQPGIQNLSSREDAAVLDLGPGPLRLESIDHFPAIWPEPFVLGEIAAAHALSDILAKGGQPDHALAIVGLPSAARRLQEDDLFQLLAGMRSVLEPERAQLVGGHSGRADGLMAGLFVSGTVGRGEALLKGGLEPGDALILTKPLGTGILFAGWMRRLARASEVMEAIRGMRRTNAAAALILKEHGARAVTDVTGFGLAGHLIEMLSASQTGARIALGDCRRYPGVDRLLAAGIRSSLLAENMALADRVELSEQLDAGAALALLFDPQTSGGLLAGVPQAASGAVVAAFERAGLEAARIGIVTARPLGARPCLLVDESLPVTGASEPGGGGDRRQADDIAIKTS